MQFFRFVLLTVLLAGSFQTCTSRKQSNTSTTNVDTAAAENSPATPQSIPITGRLETLGLTADSDWRGVNLGDSFAVVATAEKGEPFERDSKHTGYTIDLPNLETADMLYYQTAGKVSVIDIDLFLNSRQSVEQYRSELESYFSSRYGTAKPGSDVIRWTGPTGTTVSLKDVSKGKDFGLKIKLSVTGSPTTS